MCFGIDDKSNDYSGRHLKIQLPETVAGIHHLTGSTIKWVIFADGITLIVSFRNR